MTTGTPRAGARSRQLRQIAERRARAGRRTGRGPGAPLGARRPGHRRGAPQRTAGADGPGRTPPPETGAWGNRLTLTASLLPGLAAIAALIFTWVSVTQVSKELTISEQGQIAERYDRALERLDNASATIRRGAVFSLQGIMEDSPRDQPEVIATLSAHIRTHATAKLPTPEKAPDVQAALFVLAHRDPAHDGAALLDLRGAHLTGASLQGANLTKANLTGAVLTNSDLQDADLSGATLRRASLKQAQLRGATLTGTDLTTAAVTGADLTGANLTDARLGSADLKSTTLTHADLRNAYLNKADLRQTDLTDANLGGAYLAGADLAGAQLDAVRLDDTVLTGTHRPEGDLPPTSPPPTSPTPTPSTDPRSTHS